MKTPISGPINLEGKSALITGAARGIGRSICVAFARQKAKVAAIDILSLADTERELRIRHPDAEIYSAKCDISNEFEVNSVIQEVIDRYNRIDIFVGNAAVAGTVTLPDKDFMDVPLAEWEEISHINVRGTFICCRAVWPIMEKQGSGKIVLIGSLAAKVGGVLYGPYYAASKGAIHTFSKWLAKRGASKGIWVNCVCPGPVATPMGHAAPFKDEMVPLGRLGQPEDIAEAVIFLGSQASNFITGVVLDVNGGMLMD